MPSPYILLLYKKSSFESYSGSINTVELKRFKQTHERHYLSLEIIKTILKARKLKYACHYRGKKIDYMPFNIIVTVGGDGTFLEASHSVKDQVILGINSDPSWSVGRFCKGRVETFESILDSILAGHPRLQILQRMSLRLSTSQKEFLALNDVLICHHNPAAMSRYFISLNGKKEDHRSSGIWVATAAGSSGAIRSAGGKSLPVAATDIQYKVRELYPYRNQKFELRTGLIKTNDRFMVRSLMREGVIYVDGAHICLPFSSGAQVIIKPSRYPLKMVIE